ncbi:hypothetical protein DASC09_061950 [Saccharomycopsis crataegensis]|uniref:Uncharacterized protein n=1 Tax=Saccharomycopsis crataegensis TaxID=43959 RepID=A0AAV5QWM6_9ASCO|nr:hypothetical protein DASC09_061950 [Saccharomycopsis crataegensis]
MDSQKQALPFELKVPIFDENGFYSDVSSYLSAVKQESEKGDQIFFTRKVKRKFSELEEEKKPSTETLELGDDDNVDTISKVDTPTSDEKEDVNDQETSQSKYESDQWRTSFIEDFKKQKAEYENDDGKEEEEEEEEGIDECGEDKTKDIDVEKLPENFTGWRAFMINNKPSKYLLVLLPQATILKLIIYMKKLVDKSMKGHMKLWTPALFLRLSDVLEYNDVYELREVSKKMIFFKKNKKLQDKESKLTCDIIIAIVYDIYGQKDLYL